MIYYIKFYDANGIAWARIDANAPDTAHSVLMIARPQATILTTQTVAPKLDRPPFLRLEPVDRFLSSRDS